MLSHPRRKSKSAPRVGHPSFTVGEGQEGQLQIPVRLVRTADSLRAGFSAWLLERPAQDDTADSGRGSCFVPP